MDSSKRFVFSAEEKELLKSLIMEKADILENKKSDAATTRRKMDGWLELEKEFNAISTNVKRSHVQLKKCWENMKTRRKKSLPPMANNMVKEEETDDLYCTPEIKFIGLDRFDTMAMEVEQKILNLKAEREREEELHELKKKRDEEIHFEMLRKLKAEADLAELKLQKEKQIDGTFSSA